MLKSPSPSALSVLVVDDDENIRMVLQRTLSKLGYHVSTARSAEEALSTLERSFFQIVISDIMMEEMTGIELLQQIKEMNSLMQIYIMTAHSNLPNVIQCMKGGAYDYFEKPLKVEEVVTSLREAQRRAERWNELFKRHSTAASQGASSEGL